MSRRTAPSVALLLALTLLIGGCGDRGRQGAEAPPRFVGPTATATPSSTPPPTPPRPTATPRKTTGGRTGLPAGLQRRTGTRQVALTFDDGPHPDWTPKLLDQLRAARVKATFCVVGVNVRRYPSLVARIVREGHNLCNHSWQHDVKLGTKSEAQIRADLVRTNEAIGQAAPKAAVRYYRQPGGAWTPELVQVAKSLDMVPLHWDVDPQDWAKPTVAQVSTRVLGRVRAGSIVLLHDGGGDRAATLRACPAIIRGLKQRYGIVRLR